MNIVVCTKLSVRSNHEVENDSGKSYGFELGISAWEIGAIEEALRLKDLYGGKITVLSMGVPQTKEMLDYLLSLGVDEAILLCDKALAGADTLATSYALSCAIKEIGNYDLVICGKRTTDGDTAQVGPELAEWLKINLVSHVHEIKQSDYNHVVCNCKQYHKNKLIQASFPVLITFDERLSLRNQIIQDILCYAKKEIKVWGIKDIKINKKLCGQTGSATRVIRTYRINHSQKVSMIADDINKQVEIVEKKICECKNKQNYSKGGV